MEEQNPRSTKDWLEEVLAEAALLALAIGGPVLVFNLVPA